MHSSVADDKLNTDLLFQQCGFFKNFTVAGIEINIIKCNKNQWQNPLSFLKKIGEI